MNDEVRPSKAPIQLSKLGLGLILIGAVAFGSVCTAVGMSAWQAKQMANASYEADFALTILADDHADAMQACSDAITQLTVLAAVEGLAMDADHQAVDDFFDRHSYWAGDSGALASALSESERTVHKARDALENKPCPPE
ncbi:hypothetical protein E3T61_03085 [Cryobacterium lactosi]|uniref:Uncharacterized protein n=1 Tax=Cryobacterium lactosi TaxID=1259202 RepID=A0A4R9BZL1_9MICO|nr:hypothetical protein [Cryobacterium lactosi]TFD93998.1 hypothetical protein E3T61_03085 [Cryobacterium lactosi]